MTALALATFDDEGPFLRARLRMIADARPIHGEWMPYSVEIDGPGGRWVRDWTVIAGIAGALGLFALASWNSGVSYALDVGARALWSWQAFVPPAVEFGALAGAIGGLTRLFLNAGLTRLHHPAFDFDEVRRASQDRFVLAIGCDEGPDANAVLAALAEAGATHSGLVHA